MRHSTANHLLNPTEGHTIIYRVTPYSSVDQNKSFFFKQTLIGQFYFPVSKGDFFVFALRAQIGSIIGPQVNDLPLTKLFLGGSDDDLRGYRYHTVSPLNANGDVLGGRGALYLSFEPRFRPYEKIGIVPFVDIGTVSLKQYPSITDKWYKSVGIGLRYFSFFGPLRFDVAFPLDKRKFDPRFRFYVSIGQTF